VKNIYNSYEHLLEQPFTSTPLSARFIVFNIFYSQ
jgi:hypothetical protein